MRKLSPKIWQDSYKWQFEAYPFFTSVYQKATGSTKNRYFTTFKDLFNYYDDGQIYLLIPRKEIFNKGMIIINELLLGKDDYYREFNKVFLQTNRAIKTCLKIRSEGRYNKLEKWWPETQRALSNITYVLFNFDYPFDDFLKNLSTKSPKEFNILSEYIYSDISSFINQANARLIQLSKKYLKNFKKVTEEFITEYGWFQNSYIGKFKITKKWLKNRLKDIKKENKKIFKTPGKMPKKYKLLARTATLSVKFRDDKKKLLLVAAELMEDWLRYVCKKNKWKYKVMRWLSMDEILEILNKKNISLLKKAEKYYKNKKRIGIMDPIGYKEVSEKFWKKVLKTQKIENKKEISGVIGNKGRYVGRAKIVIDAKKEANKLKTGDILITSMTRPEFLPLMSRAGAFVTDEGGISCHAAIVAREMGKPCIIATKIATKVLKDGDLVEVDADKGIVKIIK